MSGYLDGIARVYIADLQRTRRALAGNGGCK